MGEFREEKTYQRNGVAGTGLGLGIAGTALGLLNSGGGALGGIFGRGWGWGNGYNNGCGFNGGFGNGYDLAVMDAMARKDAEIARLSSKAYSDESDLAIYKYFDGKIEEINRRLCQQEVFNTQTNGTLSVLASQLAEQKALLASITRTAIPESVICDFRNRECCPTRVS